VELKAYLAERRQWVEDALEGLLPSDEAGGTILKAMRYSLFAGGKRLRPILCMAGAEAVGGQPRKVLKFACAIEMIHTYSLVHDDLPAMDDDDYRRGVPTNHRVFGEGMAVLAGDGLLTEAMVVITDPATWQGLEPARVMEAANLVMRAASFRGMVGGQAADLEAEGKGGELSDVEFIHMRKTAALISASVESGGVLAGGEPNQLTALRHYGMRMGMAFQIADDLLDVEGDPGLMGKPTGSDEAKGKLTYPGVVGIAQAKAKASQLVREAIGIVSTLGPRAEALVEIARFVVRRVS